ncbi:hypothetical protein PILCRDRAFT_821188 [Piloderma croceum F 1598]|uniref:Uncharacterized protein n=1 Tax=Piloderma croceum (strain F 1598) TaxID=765440 RepID=A0A0C3FQ36_PILCF|nr:hypothetical protein PILCRDRAFT_821188 [Piloderma croceum F 1598]
MSHAMLVDTPVELRNEVIFGLFGANKGSRKLRRIQQLDQQLAWYGVEKNWYS